MIGKRTNGRRGFVRATIAAVAFATAGLAVHSSAMATATLTGIVAFDTATPTFNYDNTLGGDTYSYNLYGLAGLPSGSLATSNPFLNSGNLAAAPTRIAFDVTNPGTYSYTFLCDENAGLLGPSVGVNFFFDSNDLTPRISVDEAVNTTSTSYFPSYSADSATTDTLNPQVNGAAPGSGSLSYLDGTSLITLTEFRFSQNSVFDVDRVSGYSTTPNGTNDGVLEFTLTVTAVPEPGTILILGAAGLLTLRRRTA